ncbi:MAG: hypothetical protein Q8S31_03645 [Alphaproteobacteria bacterium]|nr:hypothetical protein [Alphaproteobacteria bacterium]
MKKIRLFLSLCAILSIYQANATNDYKARWDNAYKAIHGEKVWSLELEENKYLYMVPTDLNDFKIAPSPIMKTSLVENQKRSGNYIEISKNPDLFFTQYTVSIAEQENIDGKLKDTRKIIAYVQIGTPIFLCPIRNTYLPIDRTNYLDDAGWSEIVIDLIDKAQESLRSKIYDLFLEHMPIIGSYPYSNTFSLDEGKCVLQESTEAFKGFETLEDVNDLDAIRGALKAGFVPYDFAPHLNLVILRHQSSNIKSRVTHDVLEAFNHLDNDESLRLIQNAADAKMDDLDYAASLQNVALGINVKPFRFDPKKHTQADLEEFRNRNPLGAVIVTAPKPEESTFRFNATLEQQLNLLKMFGIGAETKESNQN